MREYKYAELEDTVKSRLRECTKQFDNKRSLTFLETRALNDLISSYKPAHLFSAPGVCITQQQ